MKLISDDVIKKLLAYLYSKPYSEVALLIAYITQLPESEKKDGGQKKYQIIMKQYYNYYILELIQRVIFFRRNGLAHQKSFVNTWISGTIVT